MADLRKWITQKSNIEITKVLGRRCNCYLISKDESHALVDTSVQQEGKILLDCLNRLNIKNLNFIMLTHSHFDHTGNAHLLQEKFENNIFIHSSEIQFLKEGYTYLPKGTSLFTKLATNIIGNRIMKFQRFPPCKDKVFTEETCKLPATLKIQILDTPGHTKGSVSFIIDDEIAIVGDTMVNLIGGKIFPPFADFPELLPKTWNKLLDTNCSSFLPAHGKEISRDLLEQMFLKY